MVSSGIGMGLTNSAQIAGFIGGIEMIGKVYSFKKFEFCLS